MRKIYVGFSLPKNKKLFAEAIKWFEGTPFSHVYIRLPTSNLSQDLIYHASGTSVNFVGSDRFFSLNYKYEEFEIEISQEVYLKTLNFAVEKAGVPYGVKQVFGIVFTKVLRRFFKKSIRNVFGDGQKTYVCSELVGAIAEQLWNFKLTEDEDLVGPKQIYDLFKENSINGKNCI